MCSYERTRFSFIDVASNAYDKRRGFEVPTVELPHVLDSDSSERGGGSAEGAAIRVVAEKLRAKAQCSERLIVVEARDESGPRLTLELGEVAGAECRAPHQARHEVE